MSSWYRYVLAVSSARAAAVVRKGEIPSFQNALQKCSSGTD